MKFSSLNKRMFPLFVSVTLAMSAALAQDSIQFALDGDSSIFYSGNDGIIGGVVWLDANEDGLQDADTAIERGFYKAPVDLLNEQDDVVDTVYADGSFVFDGIPLGNYRLRFVSPPDTNCQFTTANVSGNQFDQQDSDVDQATGLTSWITLDGATPIDFSIGAGHVCRNNTTVTPEAKDDYITAVAWSIDQSVDVLVNDTLTSDVSSLTIVSSNIPGVTEVIDNYIAISDTTDAGNFQVVYQVVCDDGTTVEATLHVEIVWSLPYQSNMQANDDGVVGEAGTPLSTDVLLNDHLGANFDSAQIISTNVPGYVQLTTQHQLNVEGSVPGTYTVQYEVSSTTGEKSRAQVRVHLKPPQTTSTGAANTSGLPQKPYMCAISATAGATGRLGLRTDTIYNQSYPLYDRYQMYDQNHNPLTIITREQEYSTITLDRVNYVVRRWALEDINRTVADGAVYLRSIDASGAMSTDTTLCPIWEQYSPIALDLDQNNRIERLQGSFEFDLTGSGSKETLREWFGPNTGILVDLYTLEGELEAISGQHLFGDQGGLYKDGYAKLATLDSDNNGWVEGAELETLGIWTDANSNTKVDSGELSALVDHQIVGLRTTHTNYLSKAILANGKTMLSEDVWFSIVSPTVQSKVLTTSVLTIRNGRLPMVFCLLAMIFIGVTTAGVVSRRQKQA